MKLSEEKINSLRITLAGRMLYILCNLKKNSQVKKNIDYIFEKNLSQKQKKHLAQAFYSHFITSLKEIILINLINHKSLQHKVEIKGKPFFLDALKENKGIILLTGHFGSWEFAPTIGLPTINEFNGKFHFIRKNLRIKILEKLFFNNYYKAKFNIIDRKNALFKTVKALKKNDAE